MSNPYSTSSGSQSGSHPGDNAGSATNNNVGGTPGNATDIIKDIWRTRPVRVPSSQGSDAWILGICAGISARYRVSTLLVRLGFLALTFGMGVGVLVYSFLALVSPRYSVGYSPWDVISKRIKDKRYDHDETVGWVAIVFLVLCLLSSVSFAVSLSLPTLVGIALAAGAFWLLHQHTPTPVNDCYATAFAPEEDALGVINKNDAGAGTTPTSASWAEHPFTAAKGFQTQPTPPSWDPLGAAPFAWNLSDPGEAPAWQPYKATNRRSRVARALVGCVLGIVALLMISVAAAFISNNGERTVFDVGTVSSQNITVADEFRNVSFGSAVFTMNDLKVDSDQTYSLNATLSDVTVRVPQTTKHNSYIIHFDCSGSLGSVSGCGEHSATVVKGKDYAQVSSEGKVDQIPALTMRIHSRLANVEVME